MKRYIALDALRGLTIAAMILVNTPGDWAHVYPLLLHSHWHGFSPTDLVFPLFLFIIGSALFFAFKKINFQPSPDVLKKVVKRSLLLFFIGLFLNAFPFQQPLEQLRIMGVLQRIALCYFVAALLILFLKNNAIKITIAIILISYALILAPWGYDINNNLIQIVDLKLLGADHLYHLHDQVFDPEGLLSCFPAIASVLIGFEVTKMLTQCQQKQQGFNMLLILSVLLLILGYLTAQIIPINKSLWTSSYVLVSSGYACLLLALFVLLGDIFQQQKLLSPWLVYGLNPLFIYVIAWLWEEVYKLIQLPLANGKKVWLGQYLQAHLIPYFSAINASLIYALSHVLLFWLLALTLYKKNIVVKI